MYETNFGDTKNAFSRLGDRSLKTAKSRIKVILLCAVIAISLFATAKLYQNYVQSFEVDKMARLAQIKKDNNIPSFKIVVLENI